MERLYTFIGFDFIGTVTDSITLKYVGNPQDEEINPWVIKAKDKFIKETHILPEYIVIMEGNRIHSRHQVYETGDTRKTNY